MESNSPAAAFERHFGARPAVVAAAPGRVNLIGEHVDYNGGRVLPFAIEQRTIVAAALADGGRIEARSEALGSDAGFPADVSAPDDAPNWANYLRGMAHGLRARGVSLPGARLWIGGDLPPGSGMSSSAALCVSTGLALAKLANVDIPPREMALMAQKAEHDFAGMPCGIMDQYVSCFGREDHALLLDCQKLSHEYVPFRPEGVAVLAIPSGVKHALADGAYEKRVESCKKAVAAIAENAPGIASLRDVTTDMLETSRSRMDDTTFRRARHVVSEIARVTAAVETLGRADFRALGDLLWRTQDSLRDDYEVSCPEIDELIRVLKSHDGVMGARMVGGGFGGVVLALVAERVVDQVGDALVTGYYTPHRLVERPFRVRPAAGAGILRDDRATRGA